MKKLSILFVLLIVSVSAQTTLYVAGPRSGLGSTWVGMTSTESPGATSFIGDPLSDQQTGQSPDDFVNSVGQPTIFISNGFVNGVASVGVRVYLAGNQPSGYTGNARFGIDANNDGAVDLFFGPTLGGAAKTQGIVFQLPTGPGNYSPSTTNLGNNFGLIPFTTNNFNYQSVSTNIDPTWTNVGPNINSVLSFSIPTQTIKDVLAQSGIIMTDQTYFNLLAFTSTQGNAINQDLVGSTGIVNTMRFDGSNGGFTDYYAFDGGWKARPIVPEPSAYGFIMLAGSLFLICYKRLRKKTPFGN